ncbi:MAG TPA: CYTH and CHAD domain-containing protein [Ramlibacter sp.]|nr:CYTH and CHAD domain-containing protein [Ramlibacter sp.]
MTEFELKLQVPPERTKDVEDALRRGTVENTRLRARYYDTADEALARKGLVLRLRKEGDHWVQTAKGPGRRGFERLEHNVPVPSGETEPEIARHNDHPVGKRLRNALAASHEPLRLRFETDVTRMTRTIETAGNTVELAFDRGEVRADERHQPVLELELERKEGSAAAAIELAQRWAEDHGLWLDPLPKAGVGRRLANGQEQAPPVHALPVTQHPEAAAGLVADALGSALQQALGNARELATGHGGDEHIHQLRVGLRRVRTTLRELHVIEGLPPVPDGIEQALAEIFQLLGQHRDRSTLLPTLHQQLRDVGAPAIHLEPPLPDVAAALREPRLQAALLQLIGYIQQLHELPAASDPGLKSLRKQVTRLLRKLHRQVRRDGAIFVALPEPERHRVRKRLKRLRYLAEGMRPLFRGGGVDRFVKGLKELQDALGEYQDAAAGRALFAHHAAEEPAAWFAVGWLTAQEREIAGVCEQACRKLPGFSRHFTH